MGFLKKAGLILGAITMIAVAGCSAAKPVTITQTTTQTSTQTSILTNTATLIQTDTTTATTTQTNLTTAVTTKTSTVTAITTAVPVSINISAASSLTNAMNALITLYNQSKPWVTIIPNYGASGTLQTQIEQGAPCDVFLSAAAAQMDNLQNENLLLAGTRLNLLTNTIVLIVPKGNPLGLTGFNDLTLSKVRLIAVGDPKSVPAGAYANTAFTELGILSAIQSKLLLGANVTQVLQYVDSGPSVDAGVVYSTDALSDSNVTVIATGPADVNATIVYPAAIIKSSSHVNAAMDFLAFLSSAQARAVFVQYGFAIATS